MAILRRAYLAISLLSTLASCALDPAATDSHRDLDFVPRNMTSVALPVRNPDFRDIGPGDDLRSVNGWNAVVPLQSPARFYPREGPRGGRSIALLGVPAIDNQAHELYQDVDTQSLKKGDGALSVSAWVWSDVPRGAFLKIANLRGKDTVSAYHSGESRWEYLTVAFPFDETPARFRLSLLTNKGTSKFAEVKALATFDDRFSKTLPDGCNPLRERVTYRKDDRIRIVIVGNSTVNGFVHADKRATFPYQFQLKLEAAFPGRFEVINFGICAWHLPSQIVTLDKTFNVNLWCNGAVWCGKEGPFSHRTALDTVTNADRNTPTISQLNPDVIIFAGMWNDVWRVLKYAESGFAPHPDEVNRSGEIPASVAYLRSAFAYADHPTPETYRVAEATMQRAMQPLDAPTLATLSFRDYQSLKASAEFTTLVENATRKFRYLSEEFIRRGQRLARIWTLSLPGRFSNSFEAAAKKLVAANLLTSSDVDRFLRNGYVDAITERIQGAELALASQELGAPSLDLSQLFHQQYGAMSIADQFALGYFLENVEDNVHFTYRGNAWIADQVFAGYLHELERLSRSPPPYL